MPSQHADNSVWKSNPTSRQNVSQKRIDSSERRVHRERKAPATPSQVRTAKERAPSAAWWNAAFGGRDVVIPQTKNARADNAQTFTGPSRGLPYALEQKHYDTLTVLVPGTFAPLGPLPTWYHPTNGTLSLFDYLRDVVFPGEDLYVHRWNSWGLTAASRHRQRVAAAQRLLRELRQVSVDVLRIIGHSHGANVATMATRDDLVPEMPGLKVETLVLLSPAIDLSEDGVGYAPQMDNVGDPSVPLEERRFFTFHPEEDGILGTAWGRNYQHTELARHETLFGEIAPNNHWSSTYSDVWEMVDNRLADRIRTRPAPGSMPLAEWPRKPRVAASPEL
jgi:hypothetical protein